jgi:hypothetical protein
MDSFRIASTTTAGLRPLGASGQRSHALLVDTLGRHLSEAHARLFAEPVPSPDGARIDWYAAFEGEASPFERADPQRRERAQAELGRLAADIEQLAERLERSTSAEDKQRAAALRHALRYPDDGYIWIVDGHPVVTAWAHVHEDVDRPGSTLSAWIRRTPRARPEPAPTVTAAPRPTPAVPPAASTTILSAPAVADRERRSWLGLLLWLLLLALLVAIALRLLPACGVAFPGRATLEEAGILNRCPGALAAVPRNDLERETLRQDALESEIDRLRRDLALRQNECRSQAAREPDRDGDDGGADVTETQDSETQEEAQEEAFDERVEREGGETGAMTISLLWQGQSDLDLLVRCPTGEIIDYNRTSGCGGRLQIDMNSNVNTMSDAPIEHVVWPGGVQPGGYDVGVKLYARREQSGPIPFQVRVQIGEQQQFFEGSVANNGDVVDVTTVQIP